MSQPTEIAEPFALPKEIIAKIDKIVPRYPSARSATLPLLHLIQDEKGYISEQAIEWIAERLGIEPIKVLELVTFYPMFRQKPIGRRHVKVCRTLSCALNGGAKVCEKFKDAFGVELNEVSEDGEVTVEYVECIASCGTAPVVQIDEVLHENVTEERADELIEEIRSNAKGGS
ncbi:NADH-quinone oxidoreductase subunit NuoE family protein [Puniceicoccus vermicola]|uniref:NAD(P)H-dependent oxidoreductase subunit E n=1 Tax=Puniceicoccus vermicola TaxID=388746 RepID=A0A7X1AVT8_9BACT|nr:NAD(P)H-dependent oxidoreductase subunit E [Puniceicoccus vermicola]MBC2600767.1 NAD(P)H-dependent oxidoreductase subunit E [Puniceicoccus vermicola]